MAAGAGNMRNSPALDLGGILSLEQLAEAKDGIKRGSQFMAHAGEKLALCSAGLVGGFFRRAEYSFRSFPLGHVMCDTVIDFLSG